MENSLLIFSNIYMLFFAIIISLTLIVPRISMKNYIILSSVLMGALMVVYLLCMCIAGINFANQNTLFLVSFPSCLYFFIISKYRNGQVIFAFCFGDMMTLIAGTLCGIASSFLGGNIWILFWGRILLLPIVELLIIKFMRKFYLTVTEEDKSGWWLIAAVSVFIYIILIYSGTHPTAIKDRPADVPLFIAYITAMLLTFVIIFKTIANQHKIIRYEQMEKLMALQIHSFENTIKTLEQNEQRLRIIRHDLRHYENCLRSLAQTGSREDIIDFIHTSTDILAIDEPVKYCESTALNSILMFYIGLAQEAGCSVKTKFQLASALPVKDVELCMVFANAIENAINACKKIENISERKIRITCLDSPQFVFEVANTYVESVRLDESGVPVSAKRNHGYGTQSILAFAKTHNALVDYDLSGGWFKLRVLISNGEQKK